MRLFRSLLVLPVYLILSIAQTSAAEITLKFGHAASTQTLFHTGMEMFAEAVAEKTGGAIEIQVFGTRQLGDDKQLLEGARLGTLDGALVSSPLFPLAANAKAFSALQLPFLVGSYDQLAELLSSEVGQKLLDSLSEKGLKGLGYYEAGLRHFLSRSKPVLTIEDFQGIKTRIIPIPLHKQIWEAMGTNPVGVPFGELYTALETGVVDATEINLASVSSENLYQTAKQFTLTGHYFWPGVLIMNQSKFNALSEEHQKALVEAGHETIKPLFAKVVSEDARLTEELKTKGVEFHEFQEIEEMRKRMQPILDEWATADPLIAEFINAARANQ